MKRILTLISVFALFLTACEGPQGPPGFDGEIIASSAFEIVLDFTAQNNYEFIEPYGFNVLPTDVTLVYIEWEVDNGESIWRLLPQNIFFDNGTVLVYNFDFTQQNVRFFLDGTTDFDTLDTVWTQNQAFRVVVVPADNVGRFDYSDFDAVVERYNIESFPKR